MENILLIALNVGKELRGEKMSKENKLLIRFTRFMLEHGIECEEDIYQNDDIDRDSFELIEDLFNIVKSNNSRKDDKQTNADRIRNMSDEELAEWLTNMCDFEKNEELYKSIYNLDTEKEEEIHDSYGDLLKWLQSEAEVIELRDETEIVKQSGVSDDVCE